MVNITYKINKNSRNATLETDSTKNKNLELFLQTPKEDIQKPSQKRARESLLFEPGRIVGTKGSPWMSRATSRNTPFDYDKIRGST